MASKENQTRKRLKRADADGKPNKSVVTGMQNELRTQMLVLLNERTASRPEICKELEADFNRVRHEMKMLQKVTPPLIELVFEKPIRGTVEKFFRATTQAQIDQSEWPGVPDAIKGGMRGTLLGLIVDDAVAAVSRDTFDSLENAHMSWTPMILDEEGWQDLVAVLREALEKVERIKEGSAERLIAQDAKGISCTASILAYGSANDKRKVGPPTDTAEGVDGIGKSAKAKKTSATGKARGRKLAVKQRQKGK